MSKAFTPARIAAALAVAIAIASLANPALAADPGKITISADKPGAKMGPMFYGLMTEEINYSYDGGLYANLIQNRIFKNPAPAGGRGAPPATQPASPDPQVHPHWTAFTDAGATAAIATDTANPINTTALTTSLRVDISAAGNDKRAGVANDGFWGIPVKPNTEYKASFYARGNASFKGPLTVDIESNDGKVAATGTIPAITDKWAKYELTLKTGANAAPSTANKFVISATTPGTFWINMVGLVPPTYHDRPNGFRIDLMELLGGLHPNFLRFPGGNYVEGNDFQNYFNWKITVGPFEERPGHMSPWRYRSSDGMGLLEFCEWCEDLKMEPVLAVFAGHILGRGNTAVTGDELKPYVQDAVDEIEYVTGDKSTKFGAMRAKDGHPDPFKLTYVEIGNEDNLSGGTPTYNERFTAFYDPIKAKYPSLQLISTLPPLNRTGGAASNLTRRPDVIDDHLYSSSANLQRGNTRFDKYDRTQPKIFMGEWASNGNGQGQPTPNLYAALGDASFLSGLERNCDVVVMQCYAPLMINVNPGGSQWPTNLIGYNALSSFGSPSYYAQKMFSENRGDTNLPVSIAPQSPATPLPAGQPADEVAGRNGQAATPNPAPPPLVGNAFRADAAGEVILKMVNTTSVPQQMEITLDGVKTVEKSAKVIVMSGQPTDQNNIENPTKVAPKEETINDAGLKFVHEFPPYSVSVIRLKAK